MGDEVKKRLIRKALTNEELEALHDALAPYGEIKFNEGAAFGEKRGIHTAYEALLGYYERAAQNDHVTDILNATIALRAFRECFPEFKKD